MKKILLIFLLSTLFFKLFAVIEETASFKGFLYGNAPECEYDNWLSHVAEGIASAGYNIYAPFDRQTNGFGDYKIFTSPDSLTWSQVIELFLSGQLDLAQNTLNNSNIPYEVVIFHDTDTGHTYHMLREIPNFEYYDDNGTPDDTSDDETGAFDYGWGLYVFYPNGPFPHITTAPHPNDDFPSVPIAGEVFEKQSSKFLIISGTGREVKWTHIGQYNNSKSLCDPSRVEIHAFNVAYKQFCNYIRSEFDHREFSIQIHSYDWGTHHWGMPNVQISGGNHVTNPDLPIRDNSSMKLDLINATNFLVHPANDIGIHDPVYLNDFYGVHCEEYPFMYSNGDTTFAVNTHIDLPGYSSNRQMLYTQQGFNQYDNFEPFFHIEMDELPNVYPQTNENYWWFYGWDSVTEHFDYNHLWDRFIAYYSPWISALTTVLPHMFQMNDNQIPVAPTDPEITGECAQNVELSWKKGDSYDFYSYEIFFSNEPIENGNYQIIDRSNDYHLASLATTSRIFYGLTPGQNYYFKIRIKDKNGNYSDLTQEVSAYTGSATVTNFKAIGDSTFIKLSWNANYQHNCNGFNILRKEENGDYIQIDSWQNNPDLAGNEEGASYTYIDSTCEQGILYTYKLSFDDNEGYQAFYNEEKTAVARYIGKIIVSQSDFLALKDTCYFGYNEMASDGYDTDYDKYKNFNENDTYLYCQLYENNWNTHKTMEKEIKGYYDSSNELKTWVMRIKTNHLNQPTTIRLANYQYRNAQRIFLKRNNDIIDLGNGETYTFVPNSSGFYNFTIFYGNYKPEINIHPITNLLYYPFDPVNFIWEIDNTFSIDHIDLFAVNKHYNIPIQNNLTPDNLMEFQWTIPPIIADSLKLKINLIMTNTQDTLTYLSHYRFGIISPQTSVLTPEGWSLIAQNFYSPDMDYSQIYGENVEFYSWDQNEFYQTDHPEFTLPYWLYAPQDHTETVYNAEVLREATQFTLNQGWNIIPNPYKINFDISQLLFRINSTVYEYYQAVNMHLIETKVFEYNHEFIPVRYLKGGKSYYLYSFYDNIDLIYIPYYNAHNVNEKPTDWEIKITASRNEGNQVSSVKMLGSTLIQNNVYYPVYDLLKPTAKPIPDTLIFVLNKDFGDGENYYYQLAGNYDPAAETYEKIYTSKIISNSLEDIKFELNEQNLPGDYMVYLKIGEEYMQITPSEPITISPDSELIDLQIVITNFVHLNSQNDVIASVYNVKNYPNPFNPTTTISFYSGSNNQKTTIKIYNLKGQLVTTLLDKKLSAGEHKIIWDGKNKHGKSVSTGVYFYKISFGSDKSIVKKMIMLK